MCTVIASSDVKLGGGKVQDLARTRLPGSFLLHKNVHADRIVIFWLSYKDDESSNKIRPSLFTSHVWLLQKPIKKDTDLHVKTRTK